MKFNEYLKTSGILECAQDTHEYHRFKELATTLHRLIGNQGKSFSIPDEALKLIGTVVRFCQKLFGFDIRMVEHIPYATVNGLADVFFQAISGQEIVFLSFASNALTSTGKIREKKQYDQIDKIASFLGEEMKQLPFRWRYEALLADYDFLFPRERFAEAWVENLTALRNKMSATVKFLSEVVPEAEFQKIIQNIDTKHGIEIDKETEKFAANKFFVASFKTTPERNRYQMLLYATLGIWFEQNLPACIVLDIQKQMYPYEQPYFDRFRKVPLPLLRYPNGEKKMIMED